ncbi:MAG: Nif3-like dinuclear metal center hexameric protein [Oligoflexia bacterium]|nr:Nif3-like dinuclear metal center hexameric protein [Oligoflexia bacterium]
MADRNQIVSFINDYLKIKTIKDASLNGLQVEGTTEVNKIVFGVSASLELFRLAGERNADMIIVHHGLIWNKPFAIRGIKLKRIRYLLENNINFLAYHIPLDLHPEIGNNARIIKLFKPENIEPFGFYDGNNLGFSGKLAKQLSIEDIEEVLKKELNSNPYTYRSGKKSVSSIAVVSGGAADMVYEAAENGIDLYITGENAEFVQETCREYSINFISAGHYNSEKPGITALQDLVSKSFRVNTEFIDIPNPV